MKKVRSTPSITHEQIDTIEQGNDYVKKKLDLIEQKKVDIELPSISFGSSSLSSTSSTFPFHLKNKEFVLPEKCRVYSCSNENGIAMCGNEKSLLICEKDSLLLFDENFIPQEDFHWTNGSIYCLCWIDFVKKFLLLNDRREIYLINENHLSIYERIESIPSMNWWSSTCYDKYLYLSTYGRDPIVVQIDLSKSFQLIKQLKCPFLCHSDEFIQQLNSFSDKFILIVSNPKKKLSTCQIRSPVSLNLLSSITLNFSPTSYQNSIHSTILLSQQLIFIQENSSEILCLFKDETTKIIDYRRFIRNISSFHRNICVIRTDRHLVFYQF